uniref:DUF1736 domain-containing protein n=1 Tax=Caenorhabditis japonica TaxID=281687 RepID=A0A8R1DWY1_CAEJA
MLILLLIAAIVIIILFATGVFDTTDPLQNPTNSPPANPTFRPPINNMPTLGPPIFSQLDNVFVTSTLQPYAAHASVTDLQNRGNDLAVLFRVNMLGGGSFDQNTIADVLRNNMNQLQSQLGGNAQIDPNSIFVFRLFT